MLKEETKALNVLWMRLAALFILLLGAGIGYFFYASEMDPKSRFPVKLGLDLAGGTHLVYKADVSNLSSEDVEPSLAALRDVIERRVNIFGVSEPIVQVEESSIFSEVDEKRLIVELPGVTDVEEAVRLIGETPLLEFKLANPDYEPSENDLEGGMPDEAFISTGLTGRFVEGAALEFGQGHGGLANEPVVRVDFTSEGGGLFAEITREHVGEFMAIFLDGEPISIPVIRTEITGGSAIISGGFTPDEARELARNLNFGALPVPIELQSTQSIGASLGKEALERGVVAGLWGLFAVALFLVLWYRLPGLAAVIALSLYIVIVLSLVKLIPITLTAAGLAGFILSIGLAVDANVLIFARMREELEGGKDSLSAIRDGFSRAWFSIRDGNLTSIITALVLFWFGTSIVKGFALTFGLGVLTSMFTAIVVTRTFLLALGKFEYRGVSKFLFGSGIRF